MYQARPTPRMGATYSFKNPVTGNTYVVTNEGTDIREEDAPYIEKMLQRTWCFKRNGFIYINPLILSVIF